MTLLDVIVPGQPYRPRIRRHFDDSIVSPVNNGNAVDSVANVPADSMTVVDSANCVPANADAVADSVNSSQLAPSLLDQIGGGGDDSSILLWAIVAVIFALAACLYFVFSYRRMLAANRKN